MRLFFLIVVAWFSLSNCIASSPTVTYKSQFGSAGNGNGQFNAPTAVAVDSSKNVYVTDTSNSRVQVFDSSGTYQSQFGTSGSGDGAFTFTVQHAVLYPNGIVLDSSKNIYVVDTGNNRIQIFDSIFNFKTKFGSTGNGNGSFISPSGIALDSSRNMYVADTANSRIQIFNSSGVYQSQISIPGSLPTALTLDASNNVYVVDANNNCVKIYDSSGNYKGQFGTFGTGNGEFSNPNGIGIDSKGNIYVVDTINNRIQIFKVTWTSSSQQQVNQILSTAGVLSSSGAQALTTALFEGSSRSSILSNLTSIQTSSVALSAVQSVKTDSEITSSTTSSVQQIASAAIDANATSQDSSSENFANFQGFSPSKLAKFKQIGNQLPFLKFQSLHSLIRPMNPYVINNASPMPSTPFEKPPSNLESIFIPKKNSHVWVQPFGGFQRMSPYGNITGMTSKNSGTAIGAGYNINENITVGALIGGAVSSYTLDQNQGNGSTNNYYGGFYGGYIPPEGLTVKGSVIAGKDRYTSERNITALSLIAKNTHTGWNVSGRTEVGYQFRHDTNTLTPFVSVGVSKSYQNGYQETNAYPFNLNIPSAENQTLSSEVGIKFQKSLVINETLVKPLVSFSIMRDQPLRKQGDAVLSFTDSSNTFAIPASNQRKTYAAASIGVASVLSDSLTISSLVTGKAKHHEHAIEAVIKLTYAF